MPHQCVRCSTLYDDGAQEILKGCKCGGRLFFFIRADRMSELKKTPVAANLTEPQKKQIEKDVFDMIGTELDRNEPVVLDMESVRITGPGKYEVDLVNVMKGAPLIFKLEEGKYMIDLAESFNALSKKKHKVK